MKYPLVILTLIFSLLGSVCCPGQEGAVDKKPMIEIFTSSTCPPCVAGNIAVDGVLANYPGQYSLVKYQMNWPGTGDPYYIDASAVRRAYYEVTGVPHIRSNGFSPGYPQNWTTAHFEELAGKTNISITAEASVDEPMIVSCQVEIKAHSNYPSGLRAYIIVVEQNTFQNATTNGETEFHHVVQGFMAGSEGVSLGALAADDVKTFDLSLNLSGSNTETGNDLSLVVFVQDHASKDVKQSEMVEISHPFIDYKAGFNVYDEDFNPVEGGKVSVDLGGIAYIFDSKATASKLLPGTYTYEVFVPGLFPYSGEFTITNADIQQDIFLEIPPFFHYEDFEKAGFPEGWTIYNPLGDYLANYMGRIVYQKTNDDENDFVFLVLPKFIFDQGSVLSFRAGDSYGRSQLIVGVTGNPDNPGDSFTEISSYEIYGLDYMHSFGARLDNPATVNEGFLCFKISSVNGNYFYLDNVVIIENQPGFKVQFKVTDHFGEVLPDVEISFKGESMPTNSFGLATWRDCDPAEYSYVISYKGTGIENGTINVDGDVLVDFAWNTTGINDISGNEVYIYPNPSADNFIIEGLTAGRLRIMDLEGRVVRDLKLAGANRIQIKDLKEGVYFVRIDYEGLTSVTKLVKTR